MIEFWMDSGKVKEFKSRRKWTKTCWKHAMTDKRIERKVWNQNQENGVELWENSWDTAEWNWATSLERISVRKQKTRDDFETTNGSSKVWNREELHSKIWSSLNSYWDLVLVPSNLECSCWWGTWKNEKWA